MPRARHVGDRGVIGTAAGRIGISEVARREGGIVWWKHLVVEKRRAPAREGEPEGLKRKNLSPRSGRKLAR